MWKNHYNGLTQRWIFFGLKISLHALRCIFFRGGKSIVQRWIFFSWKISWYSICTEVYIRRVKTIMNWTCSKVSIPPVKNIIIKDSHKGVYSFEKYPQNGLAKECIILKKKSLYWTCQKWIFFSWKINKIYLHKGIY